jgi:hypothetical protein
MCALSVCVRARTRARAGAGLLTALSLSLRNNDQQNERTRMYLTVEQVAGRSACCALPRGRAVKSQHEQVVFRQLCTRKARVGTAAIHVVKRLIQQL